MGEFTNGLQDRSGMLDQKNLTPVEDTKYKSAS